MTDLEIVKKCAEKMGVALSVDMRLQEWPYIDAPYPSHRYNPLTDDAQAMALLRNYGLTVELLPEAEGGEWSVTAWETEKNPARNVESFDLNRAICECVARLP
mgnify:CR=1 FL=1